MSVAHLDVESPDASLKDTRASFLSSGSIQERKRLKKRVSADVHSSH